MVASRSALGSEPTEAALFPPVVRQVFAQAQQPGRREREGMPPCKKSANDARSEIAGRAKSGETCSFPGGRSSQDHDEWLAEILIIHDRQQIDEHGGEQ